jgi:hypothetical protein
VRAFCPINGVHHPTHVLQTLGALISMYSHTNFHSWHTSTLTRLGRMRSAMLPKPQFLDLCVGRCCHARRRPTPSHGTFPDRSWDALGRIHTRGTPTIVEICILGAILCPESRFWPILGHNPGLDPPIRPPPVPTEPYGHPTTRGHARA